MAIVPVSDTNYFKDTIAGGYLSTNFAVGDVVTPITNSLSNVSTGKSYDIIECRRSASLYETKRRNGTYDYVYEQKLIIKDDRGFRKEVRAKNFTRSKGTPAMSTILSIETKKPTVVVEIVEEVKDGTTVITEVGTPVILDSISAARVYTTDEITKAIRETNTYKQFRIYQEVSIARAKKPEIEFA